MSPRTQPQSFRVADFRPGHAAAFRALNLAWIRERFPVEPEDRRQLEHPTAILDAGGAILVALIDDRVVGTCALVAHGSGGIELAKLTVAPEHRRAGIGAALVAAAIDTARHRGFPRVTLLSNRSLTAARRLFDHFGFHEAPLTDSTYRHADVAMVKDLHPAPA